MSRSTQAIEQLLGHFPLPRFLAEVWEKSHLHLPRSERGESADFSSLITLDDIDHLLSESYSGDLRPNDSVRMGHSGDLVPPKDFLINQSSGFAEVDLDRVLTLYRSGATIILNRVHRSFEPVGRLCANLSGFFGVPVQANAYVTPPRSQGFATHFDTHDVFLLQITGKKKWKLYESPVKLATPDTPFNASHFQQRGECTELTVDEGDVLYLPRGLLHEGITSDHLSFHMTIGVHAFTWSDVLKEIVDQLTQEDTRFRESVAAELPGCLSRIDDLQRIADALTARVSNASRIGRAINRRLERTQEEMKPLLKGHLRQLMEAASISCGSFVRLREGVVYRTRMDGETIILDFFKKQVVLPARVSEPLHILLKGAQVRVGDLPATLDEEGKIVLVRRLVEEGLLQIVGR